jgi:N-methylhydantoinase B
LKGGNPGKPGHFLHIKKNRSRETIKSKISGKEISPGDVMVAQTAGGGGYGSPLKRDPQSVLNDLIQEKISLEEVQNAYGVLLNDQGEVDPKLTKELRQRLSNASGD